MPPEYEEYLFSSRRLTSVEREALMREVSNLNIDRARVESSIGEAESRLMLLNEEKRGIEKEIELQLAYLGPIRRLPIEVLGYIFEQYVEDQPHHIGRLQLVCHLWRTIVNSHPSLWSRIDVVGPFNAATLRSYKQHINNCVMRSGSLPLRVTFEPFEVRTFQHWPLLTAGELLTHLSMCASPRWTSFHFFGIGDDTNWYLLLNVTGALPHILKHATKLQTLVFYNPRIDVSISETSTSLTLYGQHSLRVLNLHGVPWSFDDSMEPFHHVVDLTIGWNEKYVWHNLMLQYPHWMEMFPVVRYLKLITEDNLHGYKAIANDKHREYTARHVSQLTVHGSVPLSALAMVKFPALTDLFIEVDKFGVHAFDDSETWRFLDVGSVRNLDLRCQGAGFFWLDDGPDDWWSRMTDQDHIRNLFSNFTEIRHIEARGYVWKQVRNTFDVYIREMEEAAGGDHLEYYVIEADTLFSVLRNDWRQCTYMPE